MKDKIIMIIMGFLIILSILSISRLYKKIEKVILINGTEVKRGILFTEEITRYPIKLNVVPLEKGKLGISTETSILNLGEVPKGFVVRKSIKLKNEKKIPACVKVEVYGNVSAFIEVNPTSFVFKNETRTIEIIAKSEELGNYTGELEIKIRKIKYAWLSGLVCI